MKEDETLPLLVKGHRNKEVRLFYQRQKELLEDYYKDDIAIEKGQSTEEAEEAATHGDNLLSKIVLVANVILLFGKAAATFLTSGSSLSIISTLLDSIVDITSGLAIWSATYAIMHTDFFKYPRGRENIEGLSIIFIGTVMGMANFYIVFQSATALISNSSAPDVTVSSMAIMGGTILLKGILWLVCVKRGTTASLILAIDQRNDVLTNFVAILGAVLAQFLYKQADPIAAMLISGYVAVSWIKVIIEQTPELVGVKCTEEQFSRVMRVLLNHSEKIRCLDTLLIYHTGHKVRVEAHVVLNPEMRSKDVHDTIVDPLQRKLQCLDFVERAFIHPDYECDGLFVTPVKIHGKEQGSVNKPIFPAVLY